MCDTGEPADDFYAQVMALIGAGEGDDALRRIGEEILTPELAEWLGESIVPVIPNGHKLALMLAYRAHLHGDFAKVQCYAQQALRLNPGDPYAQQVLCQLLLWETRFKQGLEYYDVRFAAKGEFDACDWRDFPAPRWVGESLTGKHLYLWTEQGVGDIVQFCAFLPWLAAQRPASVTFGTHAKLLPLLQRSFPLMRFEPETMAFERAMGAMLHGNGIVQQMLQQIGEPSDGMRFDVAAPLGDLMVYGLPQWIPAERQHTYLMADVARVAQLRQTLTITSGVRHIGISWHTTNVQNGIIRSIPLPLWKMMLALPNCRFYSLQHDIDAAVLDEFCAANRCSILRPGFDGKQDIDGLAALIVCMDEVITIDNSNAHLAGALGVPTMLLLPVGCNYRWPILEDGATLWYKNVRVLRQTQPFDWVSVMSRAAYDLGAKL